MITLLLSFDVLSFFQSCGHLFTQEITVEHLLSVPNWGIYKEDMACSQMKIPLWYKIQN
jgi:hypothetical protein